MNWKKILLKKAKLYVLIDTKTCRNPVLTAQIAATAGADILQLRSYDLTDHDLMLVAKEIKKICQKHKCIFIVNNRIDIAYLSKADGIHLGQSDIDLKSAKSLLGKNKIFGNSCHNNKELKEAIKNKFDYISAGPIFKTKTKPEYKQIGFKNSLKIFNNGKIPAFAIGGINLSNIDTLIQHSMNRIAVCESICRSKDVKKTIKSFITKLN